MTSLAPFDPDHARLQIRRMYQGQLTNTDIQDMQESLSQQHQAWEEFLADPQSPQELSETEASAILENVLQALPAATDGSRHLPSPAPTLSSSGTSSSSFGSGWLAGWKHWLLVPSALVCLVLIWPWLPSDIPQAPSPAPLWTGKKNGSLASRAFLHISLQRSHKNSVQKLSFEENGFYELGDVFYFRFLVIEKGYIYLLRQDNQGRLEQLYPFTKKTHTFLQAGHHALRFQGKPVPYVLEQDILGYQTLVLVHTPQPMIWPTHQKDLSLYQQKLVQHADHTHFTVLPQNKMHRKP